MTNNLSNEEQVARSIASKWSRRTPCDNQGRPAAEPTAWKYDDAGNLIGPANDDA